MLPDVLVIVKLKSSNRIAFVASKNKEWTGLLLFPAPFGDCYENADQQMKQLIKKIFTWVVKIGMDPEDDDDTFKNRDNADLFSASESGNLNWNDP